MKIPRFRRLLLVNWLAVAATIEKVFRIMDRKLFNCIKPQSKVTASSQGAAAPPKKGTPGFVRGVSITLAGNYWYNATFFNHL